MMSYWANFAYTGDPGRGRDGRQPAWQRWGEDGSTSIVLDTAEDQGIHMITDKVTRATVLETMATDPEIDSQRERCALYLSTFGWGGDFDRAEYDSFGTDGCAEFDPEALVSS
jgi:para-nitrobenzyl esterase